MHGRFLEFNWTSFRGPFLISTLDICYERVARINLLMRLLRLTTISDDNETALNEQAISAPNQFGELLNRDR